MSNLNALLEQSIEGALAEIFATMIGVDIAVNSNDSKHLEAACNISAMIGLGGDLRGLLSLHFPAKIAVYITSQFLGSEPDGLDEDVKDAVGELANMLAGDLKIVFEQRSIKTELAIPTTVVGESYRTGGLPGARKVQVTFACAEGTFLVSLKYLLSQQESAH